jgi:hypothetical protein
MSKTKPTMDRSVKLAVCSLALIQQGNRLASEGDHMRAARAMALANALYFAAGGDDDGKKDALDEAKFWREAERKNASV